MLITGHNGYIGSVMVPCFLEAGYEVVGLDTGYFSQCSFISDENDVPWIRKDIRDLKVNDLKGFPSYIWRH